ncbi:MAG: SBBP repeat-containing protein [Bryobacteraceae bacterium]
MTPAQVELGAIHMRLAGARPHARLEGLDPLPGKSFYYIGNDPRKWRTGIPQYGRVGYRDVYPGVDLVFYGNGDQLEYDLILGPHADLSRVRLRFDGARGLAVEESGDLRIESSQGVLRQKKPVVYQETGGVRRELVGSYVVAGREVRFAVTGYDPAQRLVIDPVIVWATFFGGSGNDLPGGIAVDGSGNTYFAGYTYSANFPTSPPVTGNTAKGGLDAFVVKLDPAAQHILYSVILGGDNYDAATAIAIDPAGNAYVTGATLSTDFPMLNAYQSNNKGGWDAFVAKLDGSGNLKYSTYLGGGVMQPCNCSNTTYGPANPMDAGTAIVADASGNAYVTGITYSADFPFTVGVLRTPNWGDAFVTGFGTNGNLLFSTLIGGSGNDGGLAIALGSGGTLWVAGQTSSTDLPVTPGVVQNKYGGSGGHPASQLLSIGDGWVAKIKPTAAPQNVIVALTYLGGSMDDAILTIHPDAADNPYVAGETLSSNFPVTAGAYQTKYGGGSSWGDGFLAKLNPTLTSLTFFTYFGGAQDDAILDLAVDSAGRPWVLGVTSSPNLTPVSLGSNPTALQSGFQGTFDMFLLEMDTAGTSALYFTYMSGGLSGSIPAMITTNVTGLAIDSADHVYCQAIANTPVAEVGPTALQPSVAGGIDVFLMKLDFSPSITGIEVDGGGVNIAQNAWIEIYGTGLAPASVGANGLIWTAADFVSGQMPTQLGGVSVTVNGKPAYIYFVSAAQVNALTPLDSTIGPVAVTVDNGSATSAPFTANLQAVSPGFLRFGDNIHIAAEHASGSLLGPASMGTLFTPAAPGETVVLFGDGFGLPVPTLTQGSEFQSGALPSPWPQVTIGGTTAAVQYAGVISPGLYQINVVVPTTAANGDNQVIATYGGASSPTGAMIPVLR